MAVFIVKRSVANDVKFIFAVVQLVERFALCSKITFHISERHHAMAEMYLQSAVEVVEIGAKRNEGGFSNQIGIMVAIKR